MGEVSRQIEPVPRFAEPSKGKAFDVGHGHQQLAARRQEEVGLPEHLARIVHVLQRVPHRNDVKTSRRQLRMGQGAGECRQAELLPDTVDGRCGHVEPDDAPPLAVHAFEIRPAAATEIEKPAQAMPRQRLAFSQPRIPPGNAFRFGGATFRRGRRPLRPVGRRVEAVDAIGRRARIGEAEAALLALHDGKPKSAGADIVGRFDQMGPVPAAA